MADLDRSPHANVVPEAEPKTVRLTLDAGEQVDPHQHPGRDIVFYVLDGTIDLHLGSETLAVETGDVARFEGEDEGSPVAIEGQPRTIRGHTRRLAIPSGRGE